MRSPFVNELAALEVPTWAEKPAIASDPSVAAETEDAELDADGPETWAGLFA